MHLNRYNPRHQNGIAYNSKVQPVEYFRYNILDSGALPSTFSSRRSLHLEQNYDTKEEKYNIETIK